MRIISKFWLSTTIIAVLAANALAQSSTDAAQKLDEYMSRLAQFGFSGTVLAAKNDQIILNRGYGWADKENAIANTSETVFSTGSITKQFTAAAILKLEMQGKLRTEDGIGKYLEGVPEDKQAITLHHLLTHTSGLEPDDGGGNAPEREAFVQETLARPLASAPGKSFEYSNAGYGLLAAIIEKVSGQTYEQYLQENLFKPAGMNHTGYRLPQWQAEKVARWYVGERANGSPLGRPFPNWTTLGSGEVLSTTSDMFKWHQALAGETVLSAAAKKKLYTPVFRNYAYGWDVVQSPYGLLITHDGGNTLGVGADFRRFVDSSVVIMAFCNDGGETMLLGEARRNITRLVFGKEVEMPPAVLAVDSTALAQYLGTFVLPSGAKLVVANKKRQLVLNADGQEAFNLLHGTSGSNFETLNARVANMIAASSQGNHSLIHEAFKDDVPLEMVKARQDKIWQDWRARFGEYRSAHVLGAAPEGEEDKLTYARLEFERGHVFMQYYWGPMRLAGMRAIPAPPGKSFLPQSSREFVAFDVPTATAMQLRFNMNSGSVSGLTLSSKSVETVASKLP